MRAVVYHPDGHPITDLDILLEDTLIGVASMPCRECWPEPGAFELPDGEPMQCTCCKGTGRKLVTA